jgi:hypothetical protein
VNPRDSVGFKGFCRVKGCILVLNWGNVNILLISKLINTALTLWMYRVNPMVVYENENHSHF